MKLYLEGKPHEVTFVSPSAKVRKQFSEIQKAHLEKMIELKKGYDSVKDVPLDGEAFNRYLLEHPELLDKAFSLHNAIFDANEEVTVSIFKVIVAKVPDAIKAEYNLAYDSEFWQSQDLAEINEEIAKFRAKARF